VGDDEHLIRRTLAEYSRWCDDGRFDEWADLFTPEARLVIGGEATEGRESIRALMAEVQSEGRRGMHVTTNCLVDVDGDRASASTDYLFVRPGPEGMAIIAAGRYYDRLVRDADRWRFEERSITLMAAPATVPTPERASGG
jgi:3-phenylpropionate/cinnamic acid dioxygenase small subunit